MKTKILTLTISLISIVNYAQDDLLNTIDKTPQKQYEAAFKALKIVNFESTKLVSAKSLHLVIAHRFGSVKNGIDDFFGLDEANTRIHFIYGISDGFNIAISRSSFNKTYDTSLKYRFFTQTDQIPVTVVGYSQAAINTLLDEELLSRPVDFDERVSVTQQILISRKFNDALSLQLIPTFFYEGYVDFAPQDNAQFALGVGGRYKLSNRWSINVDYGWHLNRASGSPFKNPLSVGVDIETGGHVFQLHFTNAQPTFESGYLGNAIGDFTDGNFYFGFNLTRVFNF